MWRKFQSSLSEANQRYGSSGQGLLCPDSKEGSEPILEGQKFDLHQFRSLSLEEKVRFAESNLLKIGMGSSRLAFKISPKYVLKLARFPDHGDDGKIQNRNEMKFSSRLGVHPIVCKVVDHDQNFEWIISEIARPLTNETDFEQLSGIPWSHFKKVVHKVGDTEEEMLIDFFPKSHFTDNQYKIRSRRTRG
jgi:hypothetical protein